MSILLIVLLLVLVVALYPVIRDLIRTRKATAPSYVEGLQHLLDGRLPEAIERLKETVARDTTNVDAYIRLGAAFIKQGEVERGIKVHEALALRHNLSPADELKLDRTLASDYLLTDRRLKAMAVLEEILRLDPANRWAVNELFRLCLKTESWDKCRALLKNVARRPSDHVETAGLFAEFGRVLSRTDREEADYWFKEATRLDPGSLAARLYYGDSQIAAGETEAAIRTWTEIISLAPGENYLVRRRLESAYYDLGRYDEIAKLYEQLLRKVPEDSGLALALAGIYQKKQDLRAAVELLRRSADDTQNSLSQLSLVDLHLQNGNTDAAQRLVSGMIDMAQAAKYRCPHCGSVQPEPFFRCASCLRPAKPARSAAADAR
ncbi:MAG: tetratricopeptide repeat protein [candidate division WOR-3 bacterium]|nr:MAG: tetratricopeptide repeat protein [candidate division WOR-3 bacterium]